MAFRPDKKPLQFSDLKSVLAQSKETEAPVYQVLQVLLDKLTTFQTSVDAALQSAANGTGIKNTATKFATYHTKEADYIALPNSSQLLAGAGIEFDDTVSHKRTIKVAGAGFGGHYDCPLSDGDLIEANLIYAAGECIIVQVPI